ncbi:hypothetical protein EAO28_31395 [Klebsiella pneumoniae]|uniref:Uncharacterized protein n=1 Tax=Klebsiella pneumoniae TaxID=573 RepID=A0A3P2EG19_KLEPN|nr:hypothetical protein EAO28_31395 [Klebsiella pneumoniae]
MGKPVIMLARALRKTRIAADEKLVDTMLSIKIDKLRAYLQNTPAANPLKRKLRKRPSPFVPC